MKVSASECPRRESGPIDIYKGRSSYMVRIKAVCSVFVVEAKPVAFWAVINDCCLNGLQRDRSSPLAPSRRDNAVAEVAV